MTELYHFTHCPYCIRVKLALGFFNIPHRSIVVPYDNAEIPMGLIGQKKLPIVKFDDGSAMGESLDIISVLDKDQRLNTNGASERLQQLTIILEQVGAALHPLAIPHWIGFPEFDAASRAYFLTKQEKKRGTLADILRDQDKYEKDLPAKLEVLNPLLKKSHKRETIDVTDIVMAAHLYPLYLIKDGAFMTEGLEEFLERVSAACRFNYLKHIEEGATSYAQRTASSPDTHAPSH